MRPRVLRASAHRENETKGKGVGKPQPITSTIGLGGAWPFPSTGRARLYLRAMSFQVRVDQVRSKTLLRVQLRMVNLNP